MTISLAYSPCPNDTFIFYAMMHRKVDTEGLEFNVVLGDVAELNQQAKLGTYDISKLSFHALYHLRNQYQLLQSGAALGNKCGPLLISKNSVDLDKIDELTVAIPGTWTTANFLLNFAFPSINKKEVMVFSAIENAVLTNNTELGLIIHENRFTYLDKGLRKVMDLGDYWEQITKLPIPLGGIALHSRFDFSMKSKVERVIRRSLQYAWENIEETMPYLRAHAQEMDDDIIMKHVNLYVNEFSLDLGSKGNQAVDKLFEVLAQ